MDNCLPPFVPCNLFCRESMDHDFQSANFAQHILLPEYLPNDFTLDNIHHYPSNTESCKMQPCRNNQKIGIKKTEINTHYIYENNQISHTLHFTFQDVFGH